ncbi:MAG: glycosyltransferase family 2 protein, partial [Candidatus Omnitrophica bacterium]|nr:glycosyltransferase family 2 protein [Candidatus Omnitrophota bacterium]
YEIIIIDNASKDDSLVEARRMFSQAVIIQNSQNLGFAAGNNVGISMALEKASDYIMLLNNDTVLDSQCLKVLVEGLDSDRGLAALGPAIFYFDKPDKSWFQNLKMDWRRGILVHGQDNKLYRNDFCEAGMLSGCAVMLRASVFKECGLFDESFFLYAEDTDLFIRIKEKGYRFGCLPQAKVWHKIGASGIQPWTTLYLYYVTRNRLFLLKKHKNLIKWLFFIPYIVYFHIKMIVYFILKGKFKHLMFFLRGVYDFARDKSGQL